MIYLLDPKIPINHNLKRKNQNDLDKKVVLNYNLKISNRVD